MGILGIIGLICAIWVIYDVWTQQSSLTFGAKVIWTIFAVIFNIITAIVYYFMKKS